MMRIDIHAGGRDLIFPAS
ncbi:MAG: hypothetical protein ACLTDV_13360 [Eubacterium sp.]